MVRKSAVGPATLITILHELRSGNGDDVNEQYFSELRANVGVLNSYWRSTIVDAHHIESWLEEGASDVV